VLAAGQVVADYLADEVVARFAAHDAKNEPFIGLRSLADGPCPPSGGMAVVSGTRDMRTCRRQPRRHRGRAGPPHRQRAAPMVAASRTR
jgi:hypothetical protein